MSVSGSGGNSPYGSYWGQPGPYDCGNPNGGDSSRSPDINLTGGSSDGQGSQGASGAGGQGVGEGSSGGCIICGGNGGGSCSRNIPGNSGNQDSSNQSESCSGGSSGASGAEGGGSGGEEGGNNIPGVIYENGEPKWLSYFNVKI